MAKEKDLGRRIKERLRGFGVEKLDDELIAGLKELGRIVRGDIIKMTHLAGSGHPGGSMSSADFYLVMWSCANVGPDNLPLADRDRVIVSHGHTSPGVYAVLGRLGFFDIKLALSHFRQAGSPFEGHIERGVPGVEWSTGNLGQGLSAACGFALASRLLNRDFQVFALMSDAEQAKGQVSEARRFAKKYNITNLTVVIDYNERQICGSVHEIMPVNIKAGYEADGWLVKEVDGHNFSELYQALKQAVSEKEQPVAIIAHTVMGKGVSFMEGQAEFHGRALKPDEYKRALQELGIEDDLDNYRARRSSFMPFYLKEDVSKIKVNLEPGKVRTYEAKDSLDNRTAFGQALLDLVSINSAQKGRSPIALFDCDLMPSVKTGSVAKQFPHLFFESGVQEHTTASIAGALSTQGVIGFFADFGVFGVDETYNQHRLNDINHTNLKLVTTHLGLDVGQDGKTHQCIDYIGVMRNLFGFKLIIPADPNQTDRVVRYIAQAPGNFLLGMGRSKVPIIVDEKGKPFFGEDYRFIYGKVDVVREGTDGAIITMGPLLSRAIKAWELLKQEGYNVRVLNMSCPSEPDEAAIVEAAKTGVIITYEDHHVRTGLGSIISEVMVQNRISLKLKKLGVSGYAGSGSPEELLKEQALDELSLVSAVKKLLRQKA